MASQPPEEKIGGGYAGFECDRCGDPCYEVGSEREKCVAIACHGCYVGTWMFETLEEAVEQWDLGERFPIKELVVSPGTERWWTAEDERTEAPSA